MNPPWPLVIFDFDGTLMDTEQGIICAMQATLTTLDLPQTLLSPWRHMIGLSLDTQAQRLFPEGDPAVWRVFTDTYRAHYMQVLAGDPVPFPGAEKLLLTLTSCGVKIAIASSKRQWAILRILERLDWDMPIGPVMTPTEVKLPKPAPESVERILLHHQLTPEASILVGDSIFDMQTARNAGSTACGVGWGVHGQAELLAHGADHWVENFEQLTALLLGKTSL